MKAIQAFRRFDWGTAWKSTKILLFIYGAIALGAWFASPLLRLELVASILFVAGTWCVMFKLVQGIAGRSAKNPPRKTKSQLPHTDHESPVTNHVPAMRRRFAYFDAEKGEEVYTMESVQ